MSESETQIEQMQRQLELMAAREQMLMTALNEALEEADRKLLDDVRSIALEHEARRSHIFSEMQVLANRIGAFPVPPKKVETVEYQALDAPTSAAVTSVPEAPEPAPRGGDWRKATEKIAKELDFHFNGAKAQRAAAGS